MALHYDVVRATETGYPIMPREADFEEEWDGEFDEDADKSSYEEDEATIPCPYCRRQIHEDSQRCPYCEHYLSDEDASPQRKPWWIILGVIACLYIVYRWIVGG